MGLTIWPPAFANIAEPGAPHNRQSVVWVWIDAYVPDVGCKRRFPVRNGGNKFYGKSPDTIRANNNCGTRFADFGPNRRVEIHKPNFTPLRTRGDRQGLLLAIVRVRSPCHRLGNSAPSEPPALPFPGDVSERTASGNSAVVRGLVQPFAPCLFPSPSVFLLSNYH